MMFFNVALIYLALNMVAAAPVVRRKPHYPNYTDTTLRLSLMLRPESPRGASPCLVSLPVSRQRLCERTTCGAGSIAEYASHVFPRAIIFGRQTSNIDKQLIDEIKSAFEDKIHSIFRRVESCQTSNAAQQLVDEINSLLTAKFHNIFGCAEARQTSDIDQQLIDELEAKLRDLFHESSPARPRMRHSSSSTRSSPSLRLRSTAFSGEMFEEVQ
ncbi:hypothetical protein B0H10DRAFT_2080156 [Mycena sp. CBHHK59/15]|nr:hypothetical protein B0H10DRAFT_2080156 [Mycena sp. CBHHK59/15]